MSGQKIIEVVEELIRTPALILFAGIAGALGYIMRALDHGQKLSKGRIALEFCASAFVGLLVIWICGAMHLSPEWTGVIVGVCGWLGASASIQVLQKLVWKKLQLGGNSGPNQNDS